jgi:hypothetical protein
MAQEQFNAEFGEFVAIKYVPKTALVPGNGEKR